MEWAAKEQHTGFMSWIEQLGPDQAAELSVLVSNLDSSNNDQDGKLSELANIYGDGAKTATDAYALAMGEGNEEAVRMAASMVDDSAISMRNQIASAGFDEIGLMVPAGMAQGIESGTKDVERATEGQSEATIAAAKNKLGINSPSRVFRDIGTGITDGLTQGITNGSNNVTNAVNQMFNRVIADTNRSFNQIVQTNNTAVNQVEQTLSRLPVVTQQHMTSMVNQMQNGSTVMVATITTLSTSILPPYEQSLQRLTQITQVNMARNNQLMQNGTRLMLTTMTTFARTLPAEPERAFNLLTANTQQAMSNMVNRVESGSSSVLSVLNSLSRDMVSAFNSLPSDFQQIGNDAMSGLQRGLEAGRSRVMQTARSIANEVRRTMQSALKINSPSHVMRDDVGRWIPAGIAVGIEKNADMVYRALDDLSTGMIKPVTPEVALGTSRMVNNAMSAEVSANRRNSGDSNGGKSPQTIIHQQIDQTFTRTANPSDERRDQRKANKRLAEDLGGLT
ncbi:phage tail length tape-measure protein [Geomicrobium sp. JCM 19038]|nr:phage tail length tape-measure protein [Geomicrobium sp. JCM 19038]